MSKGRGAHVFGIIAKKKSWTSNRSRNRTSDLTKVLFAFSPFCLLSCSLCEVPSLKHPHYYIFTMKYYFRKFSLFSSENTKSCHSDYKKFFPKDDECAEIAPLFVGDKEFFFALGDARFYLLLSKHSQGWEQM